MKIISENERKYIFEIQPKLSLGGFDFHPSTWSRRKSFIEWVFYIDKKWLVDYFTVDITILLTMVVFMDQLSQQTPPMSSKLPIIGRGRQRVGLKFCQFAVKKNCDPQNKNLNPRFSGIWNFNLEKCRTLIIGQFFVAAMILISMSLVSTIFCLKLHHSPKRECKPMGNRARFVFLDLLPTVLCLPNCTDRIDDRPYLYEFEISLLI